MNTTSLLNKMGELRQFSNANGAHLIGISEKCISSQFADQELAISVMSVIHNDRQTGVEREEPCTCDLA